MGRRAGDLVVVEGQYTGSLPTETVLASEYRRHRHFYQREIIQTASMARIDGLSPLDSGISVLSEKVFHLAPEPAPLRTSMRDGRHADESSVTAVYLAVSRST